MYLKISKILNNNAAICIFEGREVIVSYQGIGFNKKKGLTLKKKDGMKIYYPEMESKNLEKIIEKIPMKYVELSQQILEKSKELLDENLSDTLLISLADHITATIDRFNKGITTPNLLLEEIQLFYSDEFNIGIWALELIHDRFFIKLPIDEAGYIALHIINNTENNSASRTLLISQMIYDIVEIIQREFSIKIDKKSFKYRRLSTHLKFLISKLVQNEFIFREKDYSEYIVLKENMKVATSIFKIKDYLAKKGYELNKEEITYLHIHLLGFIGIK